MADVSNSSMRRDLTSSATGANSFDSFFRQSRSKQDFSDLLSTNESSTSKLSDDFFSTMDIAKKKDPEHVYHCSSTNHNDMLSSRNSGIDSTNCTTSSIGTSNRMTGTHLREANKNEKIQTKQAKRGDFSTHGDSHDSSTIVNRSKFKPSDTNIDDLVRFIDGEESQTDRNVNPTKSKKNKKKKNKQTTDHDAIQPDTCQGKETEQFHESEFQLDTDKR